MTLEIDFTSKFEKDIKKILKQGKDLKELQAIIDTLAESIPLEQKYKDHQLKGKLKDFRDCHIQPDWLLLYKVDLKNNKLILYRTGSHSELF